MIGAITAGLFGTGGAAPAAAGSYDSIQTFTLSGNQTSISFTSIPSTYKHLQIRAISRSNYTGSGGGIENYLTFNSDTANNYYYHVLAGNGATAASTAAGSMQANLVVGYSPRASDLANDFCAYVVDILDYQNTNKYKTTRSLAGEDYNGSGTIRLWSGSWNSTAAVSTVTITCLPSNSFTQYSSFALYGIKG